MTKDTCPPFLWHWIKYGGGKPWTQYYKIGDARSGVQNLKNETEEKEFHEDFLYFWNHYKK